MPLYDYQCPSCDQVKESLQKPDVATIPCSTCPDWYMERLISRPSIQPEFAPYYDDGLGQRIESRDERKRVMKAKNLVECDPGTIRPHGTRGTIFSFAGRATESVRPSGAFAPKR